jgi:hypothetical protein
LQRKIAAFVSQVQQERERKAKELRRIHDRLAATHQVPLQPQHPSVAVGTQSRSRSPRGLRSVAVPPPLSFARAPQATSRVAVVPISLQSTPAAVFHVRSDSDSNFSHALPQCPPRPAAAPLPWYSKRPGSRPPAVLSSDAQSFAPSKNPLRVRNVRSRTRSPSKPLYERPEWQ